MSVMKRNFLARILDPKKMSVMSFLIRKYKPNHRDGKQLLFQKGGSGALNLCCGFSVILMTIIGLILFMD